MEKVSYLCMNAIQVHDTIEFFANNSNLGEVRELDYSTQDAYCDVKVLVK